MKSIEDIQYFINEEIEAGIKRFITGAKGLDYANLLQDSLREVYTLKAKVRAQSELLERAKYYMERCRCNQLHVCMEGWLSDYEKLKNRDAGEE